MRAVVALVGTLAMAAMAALLAVSCKQGLGERCQVNSDCEGDLTCSQAEKVCAATVTGDIDATVPDGEIDAGIDAPDAPPDDDGDDGDGDDEQP